MIKTTVETVTPSQAAKYIATVDASKQRPIKESKIADYAGAMSRGHWMLTHQGIAFDDAGSLCDGQHRMHAVIRSGVPIETLVTRNLVQTQGDMFTFDAIDQGVKRRVGDQLHVRHGVENSCLTASATRKIVQFCVPKNPAMTVATTLAVLHYYGAEIKSALSMLRPTKGMLRAPIIGASAFCLRPGGEAVRSFISAVGTGENLSKGNPALAFRQYALNNSSAGGGKGGGLELAFCLCAMHAMLGSSLRQVKYSHRGVDFFADKQPRVVNAIREMFVF